jgi:hypothetical protein
MLISKFNEINLFILILSILVFIVLLIGLIGNILVIYVVLTYGRLKTVTNTYLLHLALSDLVFLSGVPFFISSMITRSWIFGAFICKIFFLTQGVNQYTSIIILSLLSFDRYLAVCHSSKSIIWRSRIHPNLLLTLVWILSFFLMLPIILFTTLQQSVSSVVQCTIILPISESDSLYFIYIICTSIITFIIPLILMIYFHLRIIYRIQNNIPKHHTRSFTSIRVRRKVTVLVLCVISVHLICCSPYWTFQMFTTSDILPQTSQILVPISSVAQSLLFVNSSTNPILYAFISELFRTSFKRVFYCCLTTDNHELIQERPIVRRNIILVTTHRNYLQSKIIRRRLIDNNIHSNQRLTVSTGQSYLLSGQSRLTSLVPTGSMFISETSIAHEV